MAMASQHEAIAALRPELHRYCARLTGSIIDGEDVVQETMAKALAALDAAAQPVSPLRPWLFRIAHNAAIDHLRRGQRLTEVLDDEATAADELIDPLAARAALSAFVALPVRQRGAVILKDVLGYSLEEIAATLDTTVPAVKAALVRGRAALRDAEPAPPSPPAAPVPPPPAERALLARYVALFNARDWAGLEALLADDVRLDLVARARRQGREVAEYYGRYRAIPDLRAELGQVDGRDAILVFDPASTATPAYFITIEWRGDAVALIRDYRYVPYVLQVAGPDGDTVR